MSDRILILLGSLIIGVAIALLQTYNSNRIYIEAAMTVLAVTGTLISIFVFLRKKHFLSSVF